MSLRTYPLIVHPEFIDFVSGPNANLALPFFSSDEEVTQIGLPTIPSIFALAGYLQVSPGNIAWMIRKKPEHYNTFPITKRSGKQRFISSPRTFLKVTQWWILDTILAKAACSSAVHGFVRGRSFKTNAQCHLGARHLLNIDIKDFFPSITWGKVNSVFLEFGYSDKVSASLADLCTLYESLPQGAPTSPAISNLVFRSLDHRIQRMCSENGFTYTRYADDLTISCHDRIDFSVLGELEATLAEKGFELNRDKTRWFGPNDRMEVTGLRLGCESVAFHRKRLNAARGWFYKIANNPFEHILQLDRVRGTLSLIEYVGGPGSKPIIDLGRIAKDRIIMASLQKSLMT